MLLMNNYFKGVNFNDVPLELKLVLILMENDITFENWIVF